jgi:hypothetical protein
MKIESNGWNINYSSIFDNMDEIKYSFKQLDLDHMDENMFTDCDNMDEIKR